MSEAEKEIPKVKSAVNGEGEYLGLSTKGTKDRRDQKELLNLLAVLHKENGLQQEKLLLMRPPAAVATGTRLKTKDNLL